MIKKFLLSLVVISTFATGAVLAITPAVQAQSSQKALCEGSGGTWNGSSCTTPGNNRTVAGTLRQVAEILSFLVGAVAVLMLIIGGLRYVLSNGDPAAATSAKNTIMYSIIGLVVAFMAYAIVRFVMGSLK